MRPRLPPLSLVVLYLLALEKAFVDAAPSPAATGGAESKTTVLILGGGVTGVIAARTLHRRGIDSFLIVEARDELGGRMQSHTLGKGEDTYIVEAGANWIQGSGGATDEKKDNPIYELAKKHGIQARVNDFDGSFSELIVSPSFIELTLSYSDVRRNWVCRLQRYC